MSSTAGPSTSTIKISPTKGQRGRKRKLSLAAPTSPQGGDEDAEGSDADGNNAPEVGAPTPAKKRRAEAAAAAAAAANGTGERAGYAKVYGYETEIAQMIYVFGEINDPPLATVHLIEDIVRSQVFELLARARQTSHLRSSRYLGIEDLIFLIRDDRVKVNRLRTYLSWKEVRKSAKKDDGAVGGGGMEMELDEMDADKKPLKKQVVKLPWELLTPFNDLLRNLPSTGAADDEDEDDDELEAYEDNIQRLREHDMATRKMTKEQYVFYSECRQASFTFRKAKRFRDFINSTAYLDVKPNEDTIDILGFLCFEMVRTMCVAALASRNRSMGVVKREENIEDLGPAPARGEDGELLGEGDADGEVDAEGEGEDPSPKDGEEDDENADVLSDMGKDEEDEDEGPKKKKKKSGSKKSRGDGILGAPPNIPCDEYSLLPSHVMTAFTRLQRDQAMKKNGGLRNWRGGPMRMKLGLV